MRLERARRLVPELEPLDAEERFRFLARSTPSRIVPFLLRHRYLVLAVLFNVPGNAIIGGGGGIGLIAGMSRLFPFPKYVLLVCLAITPVPMLSFSARCSSDLPGTGVAREPHISRSARFKRKGTRNTNSVHEGWTTSIVPRSWRTARLPTNFIPDLRIAGTDRDGRGGTEII